MNEKEAEDGTFLKKESEFETKNHLLDVAKSKTKSQARFRCSFLHYVGSCIIEVCPHLKVTMTKRDGNDIPAKLFLFLLIGCAKKCIKN